MQTPKKLKTKYMMTRHTEYGMEWNTGVGQGLLVCPHHLHLCAGIQLHLCARMQLYARITHSCMRA